MAYILAEHAQKLHDPPWSKLTYVTAAIVGLTAVNALGTQISGLSFVISLIGVFVFVGLTAWDTQKLKSFATAGPMQENLAIYGALTLYLDFVNLFLFLLRILGDRRR